VRLDERLCGRPGQRLLHCQAELVVERGDDRGGANREVLADLVVHLGLEAFVDELPDQPAGGRPGGGRGEQRRGGEPDEHTDSASPLDSFPPPVVGGLAHADRAVLGMGDQDRSLDPHLLVPDEVGERVEVMCRLVEALVGGDEDVGGRVGHGSAPFTRPSTPILTARHPRRVTPTGRCPPFGGAR
jgi:hypothetical protein